MNCDLTIDLLVKKLLSCIENKGRDDFLLDRGTRAEREKNVESFYLSVLCSEFMIFSELDLLLLLFGCEISLAIDLSVPFITTRLPNNWDRQVRVFIDNGDLSIAYTDPITYHPGRLAEVYNFVKEGSVPASVSFPKRHTPIPEEVSSLGEEIFEVYKGGISYSFDIDGICGFIPSNIPNPFKTNINIHFDINNRVTIKNKKLVFRNLVLKEYSHEKIGWLDTRWGQIGLFIVFNEREGGNYLDLFIRNLSLILEIPPSSNSILRCVLNYSESEIFLIQLRTLYPGSSFYIEIFGTKSSISDVFFSTVFMKLFEVFDVCLVPELTYDIALKVMPHEFKSLFISQNIFEKLHVKPNYKLAFSNCMANHNEVKVRANGSSTYYSYGCVSKINFYSLLEDMIEGLRKTSFLPVVSLKLAQQDLEGLKFKKGNVSSYADKIEVVQRNMESVSRLGYRFEMTTKGRYLSSVHNVLTAVYKQCEYICLDYRRFKFIFMSNLYYINSFIGGNTITDLFNNISAEMTLKEAYLKGSVNKHFLPETYNVSQFFSNNGIKRLDNSLREAIKIDRDAGIVMLHKLLRNASLKCLKEGFATLLKTFLYILESDTPQNSMLLVLEQYNSDYLSYYKIEDKIVLNYNKLGPYVVLLNEEGHTMSLSYFLQTNFLGERPRKAMMPYIYLFDFVKLKLGMTEDELLDICYTIWKHHGINIAWTHLNSPEVGSKLFILLNLDVISIGGQNKDMWLEKLNSKTKEFLAQQGMESLRPKRVKWTESEHIRLLNGIIRYSSLSSKFNSVYSDFVYGFFLTRPAKNALFDGFRTLLKKSNLFDLVKEALKWAPDFFVVEEHHNGISISDEMKSSYNYLYILDKSRYKPVSVEGFKNFYNEHLKENITRQKYEELEGIIASHTSTVEVNDFRDARYKTFSVFQDPIYVWENRPRIDSTTVEQIGISNPASELELDLGNAIVTMDHINELRNEIRELRASNERLVRDRLLDRKYLERIQAEYLGLEHKMALCEVEGSGCIKNDDASSLANFDGFVSAGVDECNTEESVVHIDVSLPTFDDTFTLLENSVDLKLQENSSPFDDNISLLENSIDQKLQENSTLFDTCDLLELDVELTLQNIKKRYNTNNFTARDSRTKCFSSSCRPPLPKWRNYLFYLVSLNELSYQTIKRNHRTMKCFSLKK